MRLHRGGQARRRRPARGGHGGGSVGLGDTGGHEAGVELGGPAVVVLQLRQPGPQSFALVQHVGQRLAVLAPEVVQQLAALPHLRQPLRVLVDDLARSAQVGGQVAQLGGHGPQPGLGTAEGSATGDQRQRRAHGVGCRGGGVGNAGGCRAVAAEQHHGAGSRLPVGGGAGQLVFQPPQSLVLVGAADRGTVDLGDLIAEQVELPGPGALVASHAAQLVEDRPDLVAGGTQGAQIDVAEPVEGVALGGGVQQRLVGVLAVEVDQLRACRRQLAGRRQPPVDVGAAPPRARDRPRQHHLVPLGVAVVTGLGVPDEAALDPRLVGAGTHQDRIGPAPDEQLDRVDDHRLAGPGLAGDRGHPRAEQQAQLCDHPQVADSKLDEHRWSLPVAQTELGLEDAEEVAGTEGHEPGRLVRPRGPDGVAGPERAEGGSVERQRGGAVAQHLDAHHGRGRQHEGTVEEHVR
jgi:hypothetical protein